MCVCMCVRVWRTHHFDYFWVDGLGEDPARRRDVVDELVEPGPFDLFALEVGDGVHEVEDDAALLQLLDEQILLFRRRRVCNSNGTVVKSCRHVTRSHGTDTWEAHVHHVIRSHNANT